MTSANGTPRQEYPRIDRVTLHQSQPVLIFRNCRGKFLAERDEIASSYELESVQKLAKGGKEGDENVM